MVARDFFNWSLAAFTGFWLIVGGACHAQTVDSFEGEPQSVALDIPDPSGAPVSSTPVSLSTSLFNSREVELRYGAQELAITEDGGLQFQVIDPPEDYTRNARGYFTVTYRSESPVDLLEAEIAAIRLQFDEFTSIFPFSVLLFIGDGTEEQKYDIGRALDQAEFPAHFDIPLSAFDRIDLTSVDRLGIRASECRWGRSLRLKIS